MLDLRLDLVAVRQLFHFEIQGDTKNDEVDLTFTSLVDAANFVSTTNSQHSARITYPGGLGQFDTSVMITIAHYTTYFKPLDI